MSLTYTTWLAQAANIAGTSTTNPYLVTELPGAIDYAELRIYRDLDLLATRQTDQSQTCVPSQRKLNVPAAFVVVEGINIITPAGAAADSGTRNQLLPTSVEFLDFCWPSSAGATLPAKFARLSQSLFLLGPWPDQSYAVEIIGTQRPTPLSAGNPTTFLSTNIPDLFLAATMIHISAYQKNFGAQADDPRMAQSWESQYGLLLASADAEELRKRYRGTIALPAPPGMDKRPSGPDAMRGG